MSPHVPASDDAAPESSWRRIGFWMGLVLFMVLLILPPPASMHEAIRRHAGDAVRSDVSRQVQRGGYDDISPSSPIYIRYQQQAVHARADAMMAAAAVTALVACWWITVAIPIPVTSLLPLVLLPLVGVLPVKEAAQPYANSNIFLFMGGFIIALGIERWNVHRRIALHIVRRVGSSPPTLVLGFMLASALLSMWISNTATAMMMMPIGLAIISTLAQLDVSPDPKTSANFPVALMLGIAYACSIGGVGTPIGTPPNISFRGQFAELFPEATEIGFGQWMLLFVPLVIVFVPLVWLVLTRLTCPLGSTSSRLGADVVLRELRNLGAIRLPEKRVLAVFAATAILWMTRTIPIGEGDYGWSRALERLLGDSGSAAGGFRASFINDATVALFMAVLLFIIPAGGRPRGKRAALMNWETAKKLPWGILLLFGGGFSIAEGFRASGLSAWCGEVVVQTGISSPAPMVIATCLLMTFLTEITSNTATAQVMLPILSRVSLSLGTSPLLLMLPATLSASCAFMLPVATPPNAIVFGSGCVDMKHMVRSGLVLNVLGVALISGLVYFVTLPMLGVDPNAIPEWAR